MTISRNDILEAYFRWLMGLVSDEVMDATKYEAMFRRLHYFEFTYTLAMDKNRYMDGISLRYRFLHSNDLLEYKDILEIYPCSVLEMMVALALRMDEDIMYDQDYGPRTAVWFWEMVQSLDISEEDARTGHIDATVERLLNRTYLPDGRGGLFTAKRHFDIDMRKEEIWYQMCWHISELSEKEKEYVVS